MHRSPRRARWLALAGVAIASFLGCIDFTIVNTAIPEIRSSFHADIDQVQWVVTAFVIALSSCTIPVGRLADRHGRRRVMLASMAGFGVASLGAGLAPGLVALVIWRAVQGLACAGLYTASAALVAAMFPEQERGRALGLLFSVNGLGLALGPVAGGLLVDALGWRWIFLVNVPLIAASVALCAGRLTQDAIAAVRARVDWTGVVLLLLILPSGLGAVVRGAERGWTSPATLGLACVALLAGAALARVERRTPAPLLRLAAFRQRSFVLAVCATAVLAFFYCAAFLLMPLYLGELRGQDSAATGWLLLPTTAVMAMVSPLAGRGCDRFGAGPVMALGFAALLVSAVMQSAFGASTAWWRVLAAFACMGFGWGCILGPSMAAALAAVPEALAGTALGLATTVHNIGGSVGLAAATALYRFSAARGGAFVSGYHAVMLMLAGACIVMLSILTLARRARRVSGSAV
ncbi:MULTISPECIES: DHA2 family efflux MFS transporter permease subunit [Burkholderia]|uniref:MFS transporter n=1 Tax=Burkholderia paludis TaxID=1506587 RepID=A0A6P2L6S8_9BURK|nr:MULTISPECIES: DHA2 family efflux MFS transporter permease subunit [Burkholderia]CAB3756541.1 Multidrug resistance protein Stp [Burkholderia paludis]VWB62589.1 MFS transporter [Burkholderia paludis]